MTLLLAIDDAYEDVRAAVLAIGRQTLPVHVVDSATIANTWATVLAAGNKSGGTDPEISLTDALVFDSTIPGTMQISSSGNGMAFAVGGGNKLFLDETENRFNQDMSFLSTVATPSIFVEGNGNNTLSIVGQGNSTAQAGSVQIQGGNSTGAGQGGSALIQAGSTGVPPAYGQVQLVHGEQSVALRVSGGPAGHLGLQAILIDAGGLAFFNGTSATRPSVTGATGGNSALQSLLSVLDSMGLITDNTT